MAKIIDFKAHHQNAKKITKEEGYIERAKCFEISDKINESLHKRSMWINEGNEEDRYEKLLDLYKLLNCKHFTYDPDTDPIRNVDVRTLTKWDLFKLLIGIK